ncbi:MAG: PDZ domain-containing protein, partial [Leptospira sp.]|nr:PDZ domain-containing protein [Leptospira sp.]
YFLLKTKLMSSEQYLEKIYEDILNLEDNLGDEIMSLEESSFTAWNKLYKRTSDSPNTSISYYTKGAVLVFCMNLRILEKSRGEKDFSGIMRALYNEYFVKKARGFTKEEFFEVSEAELGFDIREEFEPFISQAKRIPVDEYLKVLGIQRHQENETVDPGFLCKESRSSLYVQKIFRGRIDPLANLYLDDEIIALEGERIRTKSQWHEILTALKPNDSVKLHIARNGRIKEIDLVLGKKWDTRKLLMKENIGEETIILRKQFFQ